MDPDQPSELSPATGDITVSNANQESSLRDQAVAGIVLQNASNINLHFHSAPQAYMRRPNFDDAVNNEEQQVVNMAKGRKDQTRKGYQQRDRLLYLSMERPRVDLGLSVSVPCHLSSPVAVFLFLSLSTASRNKP